MLPFFIFFLFLVVSIPVPPAAKFECIIVVSGQQKRGSFINRDGDGVGCRLP